MYRYYSLITAALIINVFFSSISHSHSHNTTAANTDQVANVTYLGNAALMVTSKKHKILFDPFFHSHFNIYQLVPEYIETKLKQGLPPYDNVTAIVISHAHGDHFDAQDVMDYMLQHHKVVLYAPAQAVNELDKLNTDKTFKQRIFSFDLAIGDQPKQIRNADVLVEAVRIPHAGWPSRANIQNLVFRVTLEDKLTVMHMGDADPNNKHYVPFFAYWYERSTHTAFPPYWFFTSSQGKAILENTINAKNHIGVHVPIKVPQALIDSKREFFNKPGEKRIFED